MRSLFSLAALAAGGCGFHGNATPDDAPLVVHVDTPASGSDAVSMGSDAPPPPLDGPPDALVLPDAPPFTFTGDWTMPCINHFSGQDYCSAATRAQTVTVGTTGQWHVTAHIRGVMANNTYGGGSPSAGTTGWYVGGAATMGIYDVFSFKVAAPAKTYYLNSGTPVSCCTHVFDYMAEFDVDGGTSVTLGNDPGDGYIWVNKDNLTVSGVTTTPSPYDGQFAQMDIVAITPR